MSCDALSQTTSGRAFVVTNDENCLTELTQSVGGLYPALCISVNDGETILRDGSSSQPIELPHILNQLTTTFQKILAMDGSGRWYAITPTTYCVDRKLIARDGNFVLEPDVLPTVIDADICEVDSCADVDYIIGLRAIDLSDCLEGEYYEMVKLPKSLCPTCE